MKAPGQIVTATACFWPAEAVAARPSTDSRPTAAAVIFLFTYSLLVKLSNNRRATKVARRSASGSVGHGPGNQSCDLLPQVDRGAPRSGLWSATRFLLTTRLQKTKRKARE